MKGFDIMILNQRQSEILNKLKIQKRMSVTEISKIFFVSEMTVRRDLKLLEEQGYIKRYNGGAMFYQDEIFLPICYRKFLHSDQKTELAKKTKKFFHNCMNVFIDSSSTCSYIIPLLSDYKNIHIITNSIQNLLVATENNIKCTLAGGDYYSCDMCTIGSECENFLERLNPDIAFFSSLGLSDDGFITDCNEAQNSVRKTIIKNCKTNIFLFDSHKLHKKYLYTLCTTEEISELIIL